MGSLYRYSDSHRASQEENSQEIFFVVINKNKNLLLGRKWTLLLKENVQQKRSRPELFLEQSEKKLLPNTNITVFESIQ